MRKHFLLLLLMTLLPLAGWADSYEVKVRAKAVDIQFGVATPNAVRADMFMVTDWAGFGGDADAKASISALIQNLLSFTTQRAADSDLGNYAFTLSVADGDYVEDHGDYFFINIANANGTFKQIASVETAVVTDPTAATQLVYTGDNQNPLSLLAGNGSAAFGGELLTNLPLQYRFKLSSESWGEQAWSDDAPAVVAVGTYDVQYKAKHDDRFADGTVSTIANIMVSKADASITDPTAAADLTFNGGAQALFTAAGELNFPDDLVAKYIVSDTQLDDAAIAALDFTSATTDITTLTGTNAGTYYVYYKIAGDDNVSGKEAAFGWSNQIARKSLESNDITAEMLPEFLNQTYRGSAIVPEISKFVVKDGENALVFGLDKDFVKENQNNIDVPADDATDEQKPRIKITGRGNYEGVRYIYFNIVPRNLNGDSYAAAVIENDLTTAQPYTGSQITPATGTISFASPALTLVENTDYTVTYGENTNAGTEAGIVTISGMGNYTGDVVKKFNITAPSIAGYIVEGIDASYSYVATAIKPAVTVKIDANTTLDPSNYTVTYGDNLNAGDAAGSVTIAGTGNYSGEKVVNFNITKAELIVKVADANKSFGQADPTPVVESITGFEGEDELTVDLTGAYTIGRTVASEDPGTYTWAVADNGLLTNYAIVDANPQGALTINSATVFIRPQNTSKTYGYVLPALNKDAFTFEAAGLTTGEVTALTFTVKDADENEYAAGSVLNVGEYTITASGATVSSGSYTFDYTTTATLTIVQKELSLTAKNQTIEYGGAASTDVVYEAGVTQTVEVEGRVGTDDLGIALVIDANATSIGTHEGAITINTDNLNANYVLAANNPVAGDLIITAPAAGAIALGAGGNDLQTIKDYNGQNVNVSIDFTARNGRPYTWLAETWATMTLPFEISVSDLSKVLGYAVVNVIDPSRTVIDDISSKFYGKLTMKGGNGNETKLAANKPFLVKTADAITGTKNFGAQTIVAPATDADYSVNADLNGDVKFTGTYTTKTVVPADNKAFWFMTGMHDKWLYIGSNGSWDVLPFEGYIDMTGLTEQQAHNMTFYFEELDGSTTAIKGISTDDLNGKMAEGMYNMNGMKLNTVPTQKGVYILNGKKVVIK